MGLTKTFDRVRLYDILLILQRQKSPVYITKATTSLKTQNSVKIKAVAETTEDIPTTVGIRQGYSLIPFLFNLLKDQIL